MLLLEFGGWGERFAPRSSPPRRQSSPARSVGSPVIPPSPLFACSFGDGPRSGGAGRSRRAAPSRRGTGASRGPPGGPGSPLLTSAAFAQLCTLRLTFLCVRLSFVLLAGHPPACCCCSAPAPGPVLVPAPAPPSEHFPLDFFFFFSLSTLSFSFLSGSGPLSLIHCGVPVILSTRSSVTCQSFGDATFFQTLARGGGVCVCVCAVRRGKRRRRKRKKSPSRLPRTGLL